MYKKWIKVMEFGEKIGCHQIPERSFFVKTYQMPICARCTGVLISSFTAMIVFFFYKLKFLWCLLLSFIMFLDWFIQYINIKKSTNRRRFVTGILGGYGFMTIQMYIYMLILKILAKVFSIK